MPMISLESINIDNITLSTDMSQLKSGLKTAFMKYDGNTIVVQTPQMYMPFKPDLSEEGDRHTLCLNCEDDGIFKNKLKSIDSFITRKAHENCRTWFKRATISEDFIDVNYTRMIRNGGEYSDKFKFKTDSKTKFFNADKDPKY